MGCGAEEAESVRTGSSLRAVGHDSSRGSSAFSVSLASPQADDSDGISITAGSRNDELRALLPARSGAYAGVAAGAAAAAAAAAVVATAYGRRRSSWCVAGMIYSLSHRLLPGALYTPDPAGAVEAQQVEGGQWKA
jgi:hypothetical protein